MLGQEAPVGMGRDLLKRVRLVTSDHEPRLAPLALAGSGAILDPRGAPVVLGTAGQHHGLNANPAAWAARPPHLSALQSLAHFSTSTKYAGAPDGVAGSL